MVQRELESALGSSRPLNAPQKQAIIDAIKLLADRSIIDPATGRPFTILDTSTVIQAETPMPRDLRQETFNLLSQLREPTPEEREILGRKGYTFLPVQALSLGQVQAENGQNIGYVNPSESLRAYTPPQAFEVAINPKKVRIPRSNDSSQAVQLRKTDEYSQSEIETLAPGAKAIMLPATAIAQLDIEYQKRNNGQKLIPDFWVRALDATVDSDVAFVGRLHAGDPLDVNDWNRDDGIPDIWALPAVVFVRQ